MDSGPLLAELHASLQGPLFGGFLSLGGFVFSVRSFLVVKLKESVYDSPTYHAELLEAYPEEGNEPSIYAPLQRLSRVLRFVVWGAFGTAGLQVFPPVFKQLELAPAQHAGAALALLSAVFTAVLIVVALVIERQVMRDWFRRLDQDGKARLKQARRKQAEGRQKRLKDMGVE